MSLPHGAGDVMPWGAGEGHHPFSPSSVEPVCLWVAIGSLGRLVLGRMLVKSSVVHGGLGGFSESLEGTAGVVSSQKEIRVYSGRLR